MVVKSIYPASSASTYTTASGAVGALHALVASCQGQLPHEFLPCIKNVFFTSLLGDDDVLYFPCPFKAREAVSALKALEGCAAAAIADLRYGSSPRLIEVDLDRTACFLMSAYMTTINGMDKGHEDVKSFLPDTDLNQAQSNLYRRLSANLYETKNPGEFYHIHGSLEASRTLSMLGLPPFHPDMRDYRRCIATIEKAVKKYSIDELEAINSREAQAGAPALVWDDFCQTQHGQLLAKLPPFTTTALEAATPPVPFVHMERVPGQRQPQCLAGIKVIEFCRIIAGPVIGRSLAAHGASVLKVTSPYLPDVPFFQVDVNTGKHTTELHLHDNDDDRAAFERLLAEADVLIDGYRPGALDRLGYGPVFLADLARARGKGFVYVAEDCFGGTGAGGGDDAGGDTEWASRPGWQQIADCVTGVAWDQGRFMGLDEPVVPPFPMSDYGTGVLGAAAAMSALYLRASRGGSWACRTSLCQYDVFLRSLGALPPGVQARMHKVHDRAFFDLRHHDSVDEVGRRAVVSIRRLFPHLFADGMMHTAWSEGFGARIRWPKEALKVRGLRVGHVRAARPNGFDPPSWNGWEVDEDVALS